VCAYCEIICFAVEVAAVNVAAVENSSSSSGDSGLSYNDGVRCSFETAVAAQAQ
jgi:hypothetical protein